MARKRTIAILSGALAATLGLATIPLTAIADQVILDDLIVDGSACIGFDCVNGESFGFDTLRLKENNLRMHFDDTSTSASFPDNDWRIVINDSSNGGDEYFGVEDSSGGRIPFRVEAGARSHALFVESTGDIGIGTNNPVVDLHVKTGDTPTLRLEQDGTSGFTPQTWDMAGNETNFFVRDVTNGSTLPLRVRPSSQTSSIDIRPGSIGLFNSSPSGQELVMRDGNDGNTQVGFRLDQIGATATQWDFRTTDDGGLAVTKAGTGVIELQITAAGNITCPVGRTINGVACTGA